MGNTCLRPALALDDVPPGVRASALFALRHPKKYRCVCELEATMRFIQDDLVQNNRSGIGSETAILWDDYAIDAHRSCINCLENQMLHLKSSVVHLKTSVVEGRKARKKVSVCEKVEEMERWGDAGAFLFQSEGPAMPPSAEKDPLAPAQALIWKTLTYADAKARLSTTSLSTLTTCWEGDAPSTDLSGASTPVIPLGTPSLLTWAA